MDPAAGTGKNAIAVLLIEDSEADYLLARAMLTRSHGARYAVTWTDRLQGGLERLSQGMVDVVLLDLSLPDSSGWETFETLREKARDVPLIVLTGLADEDLGARAVQHGAQDYLVKGTLDSDGQVLGHAIRYAVERHRLQAEVLAARLKEEHLRREKLESLGVLAGGIAHDFNNLLMGIVGNIALARDARELSGETKRFLDEAESASLRATSLARQLLTFARGGQPVKALVSVAELLRESVTFALRGSIIRVDLRMDPDLWWAELDRGQFGQVVHNIAINAVQAMPRGGCLTVTAANVCIAAEPGGPLPAGRYVCLTFRDQGIGIPPENLTRVFDPYFTTKQTGSGLGLATSHAVVQKHGGSIAVTSTLGEGSLFTVLLPARERGAATPTIERPHPPLRNVTVLAMDDEPGIRRLLADYLGRLGCQVTLAQDGREAVECYRLALQEQKPFDVVVLDLTVVGGMGGSEAIRELCALDPHVSAIVSSGYATGDVMANYARHGFKAVLAKPYRLKDLAPVLEDVLARRVALR